MAWKLIGNIAGKPVEHELEDGVHLIGRADDAALQLSEPSVSRHHAEIRVVGTQVTVRDLGSHNGTKLNAIRLGDSASDLRPGDLLEVAHVGLRVEGPGANAALGLDITMLDNSGTLAPNAEISWDEFQTGSHGEDAEEMGVTGRQRRAQLFRVLAEAGALLTTGNEPEELFDPILDLVDTAMDPERTLLMLIEGDPAEPVIKASRVKGGAAAGNLALSRTMMKQVVEEKKSFLTSDAMNDSGDGMMSMISQGIRSAVAVPLFDNENVIGLLYADDSSGGVRFDRDGLAAFTLLANVIAVILTHARLHALEEEKRRQDAELSAASDILENIIPAQLPECAGFETFARIEPCYEVGGDLYDAVHTSDGRYAFLVGDVAGKGMGAALLVSHILSWARFMIEEGWQPLEIVQRLNNQTCRITDHLRFATFFLGILDPATGRIEYVNAGHNPPLIIRADGTVENCPATGMPIGVLEDSPYRSSELQLDSADVLALFSDGIPETQKIDDEDEFGDERFEKFLVEERTAEMPGIFDRMQQELADYRQDAEVGDDVTLMLLRRMADAPGDDSVADGKMDRTDR